MAGVCGTAGVWASMFSWARRVGPAGIDAAVASDDWAPMRTSTMKTSAAARC